MLQLILTTLLISVCRSYEIPLNPISDLPVEQGLIDKTDLLPESSECCYIRVGSFSLGGEPIFRGEFPSLALLHYVNLERNSSFPCAGTLITKQYVVTAGHCVTGQILRKAGKLVGVRLGEYDWSKTTCSDGKCNGGVLELEIGKIIPHKEYVDTQKSHDIALIRLAKPLDHFQYNISPTCLRWVHKPLSVTSVPNEKFTVVGWGQTLNEQQSKVANKVYLPHYDLDQCAGYYKRYNVNLTDKQICAGGEFKVDACGGDSGGPLITNIGECDYLDGIVSFGRGCGLENWPGVYTNITAYRDWIMENLEP